MSCKEALEVEVEVKGGSLHFNLFKAQGRGFMESRIWGDWNLLTSLSHLAGPHRSLLCVFRGGVLCQPVVPSPLVSLWEAVYLSLSLTSPLL